MEGEPSDWFDSYKKIVDLNKNGYLKNIKSIRYLETGHYRSLLSFIDSAPYQVFIMGHSCGNSDRTLLNTLFEHKNCISIKPFYHQKEDGTDDYIDIVQNISRNFKDAASMRDRVVNKKLFKFSRYSDLRFSPIGFFAARARHSGSYSE